MNLSLQNFGDVAGCAEGLVLSGWLGEGGDEGESFFRRMRIKAAPIKRIEEARTAVEALKQFGETVDEETLKQLDALEISLATEAAARQSELERIKEITKVIQGTDLVVTPGCERHLLGHFGPTLDLSTLPRVQLAHKSGRRLWPVLLFYPMDAQSDMLEAVDESSSILEILQTFFTSPRMGYVGPVPRGIQFVGLLA